MMQNNKAILEQANAAIIRGDYEGFLDLCTEDTQWQFIGDKTLSGKQAVREWMAVEYRETPTFRVTNLIEEGDHVVALGSIAGRNEDGAQDWRRYCDVWRFENGKMAALQAFVI